jgi:hypothetical protein
MPKQLTRKELNRAREQALWDYHRAQQRKVQRDMFPSLQAGSRGATSPLGGQAKPAQQPRGKR